MKYLRLLLSMWVLTAYCTILCAEETGLASYYAKRFHGKKTANGEVYSSNKYTAAHRTLPFGTFVKVTNLRNDKYVVVKITDRGPHRRSRVIDLSYIAAEEIDLIRHGVAKVKIEVVKEPNDFKITPLLNLEIKQIQYTYTPPVMRKLDIKLPDLDQTKPGSKKKKK